MALQFDLTCQASAVGEAEDVICWGRKTRSTPLVGITDHARHFVSLRSQSESSAKCRTRTKQYYKKFVACDEPRVWLARVNLHSWQLWLAEHVHVQCTCAAWDQHLRCHLKSSSKSDSTARRMSEHSDYRSLQWHTCTCRALRRLHVRTSLVPPLQRLLYTASLQNEQSTRGPSLSCKWHAAHSCFFFVCARRSLRFLGCQEVKSPPRKGSRLTNFSLPRIVRPKFLELYG